MKIIQIIKTNDWDKFTVLLKETESKGKVLKLKWNMEVHKLNIGLFPSVIQKVQEEKNWNLLH
jgi:hypothetical protein